MGEYAAITDRADAATYSLGETGSQFTGSLDDNPAL